MKGYSDELEAKLNGVGRKKRSPNGACTSKMMSFRIDAENVAFLALQRNKGGLVNHLLREERKRRSEQSTNLNE